MKIKYLLFLFFTFSLFATEELEVSLETETQLYPLYIYDIRDKGKNFDSDYLQKIKKVLEYDFANDGYFMIIPRNEKMETSPIENLKMPYAIKATAENKTLHIEFLCRKEKKIIKLKLSQLQEKVAGDRQQIHNLHDHLLMTLFQKKGIASLKLIYTVRTPNPLKNPKWISEIWTCDYDGANPKQVSFERGYIVHPLFLPKDKNKILFVSYLHGQPKIYISALHPFSPAPLVQLRGNQLLPAISLSSEKLAFISDADGRPDIFMQRLKTNGFPNGKPVQIFSFPRATQASPTFSPDSDQIAFVSDKDGTPRIYMANAEANASNERPSAYMITKKNRENVSPSWSPDGTKLTFSAKTDGVRQIWIYDFSSGEEKQLTTNGGNKENPIWAPDGIHVVYNTEDKESSELYIINIQSPVPVQISNGSGRKRFPSWEPY